MVELTSGRLRWVPAAASARQPAAVVSVIGTLSIGGFWSKAGVRASISARWPISTSYCNSFATASSNHENDTGAHLESTEEVLYAEGMIKIPVETPTATLRYALAPDEAGIAAIEATFAAYDRMMAILAEVAPVGANLVALHAQAYEKIRVETGLPARLVTLGLRDRAGYVADTAMRRIPLDDKLFAIKGPTSLTISTVQGRVLVPFDVPGYVAGWESPFPAHLVSDGHAYEIQIAVKSKSIQPEEKTMLHEGILARMGRLLAAIASQTIDNAENSNKVALVKQAIREIDAGADEARYALGKSRAEEFRLKRRREELDAEVAGLTDKIRLAVAENREDLARAGVARQIDLEFADHRARTRDGFRRTRNR